MQTPRWHGLLFGALEAGRGWRGSLDFVQGKGDSVTPMWVLMSARELSWLPNKARILTAQMALQVETLWGRSRETPRWEHRGDQAALPCRVCEASTGL